MLLHSFPSSLFSSCCPKPDSWLFYTNWPKSHTQFHLPTPLIFMLVLTSDFISASSKPLCLQSISHKLVQLFFDGSKWIAFVFSRGKNHSHNNSFNKYLMIIYYVSSTMLNTRTTKRTTHSPQRWEVSSGEEE